MCRQRIRVILIPISALDRKRQVEKEKTKQGKKIIGKKGEAVEEFHLLNIILPVEIIEST